MAEKTHESCAHLHEALANARARVAEGGGVPRYNAADPEDTLGGVTFAPDIATTPVADGDLDAEIRELEEAIREAGCEPD